MRADVLFCALLVALFVASDMVMHHDIWQGYAKRFAAIYYSVVNSFKHTTHE